MIGKAADDHDDDDADADADADFDAPALAIRQGRRIQSLRAFRRAGLGCYDLFKI